MTGGKGKIRIQSPFIGVRMIKGKDCSIILNGDLIIEHYNGLTNPVYINVSDGARLQINGNFSLGSGVRLIVSPGASLVFGGKLNESGSGITADTLVMVRNRVEVGKDFICAWGVFISDSDWHFMEGQKQFDDVLIGDHVWIANSSSIMKGAVIGNNCIIASHSKVGKGIFGDDSLIAGVPGKVVKNNVKWSRDM